MEFVPSLAAALPLLVAIFTVYVLPTYKEWVLLPRALVQVCKQQSVESYGDSSRPGRLVRSQGRLFQCWDTLSGLSASSPKVFYVTVGKMVTLVVSDLSLVRAFLTNDPGVESCYSKPSFVRVLRILGNGLFSSSGDDWARQRSLIAPALLTKEIKSKVQDMVESTSLALEKLAAKAETSGIVDMHRFFLGLTLDVLQKTVFGTELGADPGTLFQTLKRYHHGRRELVFGLAAVIPGYRWLQERLLTQARQDEAWIRGLMKEVLVPAASTSRSDHHGNRLVEIFRDSSAMTEQEALDNSVTFLLAGHETTAAVLSWSLYLLALNPQWQHRAREEVSQVLGSSSPSPSPLSSTVLAWEHLSKLKTIGLILMEAVRLFPPQPLIGRSCVRENHLGDIRVPPGLEVIVPVAAIHRSEELWGRDAADFRPDRFENGIKSACSHPLAYLPFGSGPRTCVGQSLAMTEAKAVLAMVLLRFNWELSGSYRHEPDVTLNLQPKFGMPLLLTLLEQTS
ncbi:11-oxo-beta-amyrin 30-oxidase [Selaginella moellendorffii]|nr:11-oxo-beta-amyrin 30-oxidase [Selaginella moellendorffii]|eukprot:XP_002974628.2 11-oxo-beta-amyrin 30-oxidase [Selaginella moellendorffii]